MNDLLLNESNDLAIENGDFAVAESGLQHQYHIISSQKGEWKEWPELGVGIDDELLNENPRQVLTQIKRNLEYDGAKVKAVFVDRDGKIVVDATY